MMSFISLVIEGRSIQKTKEKLRTDFPPVIFNAWRVSLIALSMHDVKRRNPTQCIPWNLLVLKSLGQRHTSMTFYLNL